MNKHFLPTLAAAALALAAPASANDTMAALSAGGLVFLASEDIEMTSEDLTVGPDAVRVVYEFTNTGAEDRRVLVAFPMPDIKGDPDFMVSIPNAESDNIFDFRTTFNGEPVEATLHQYAFAYGIEYTDYLTGLGIPLLPYGQDTVTALNALPADEQAELVRRGLAIPMQYSTDPQGQEWQTDYMPAWTLRSTYAWEAEFPAGEAVTVVHEYRPSVGGTVAVTFLSEPYEGYDPAAEYAKKYCTDESFLAAVKKSLADPGDPYSAPFAERWISYVWSTGGNWAGPIRRFHLTIDKGRPENLVSFCWDGDVRKTSPTTFEMEATDFFPPWDRELEILILERRTTEG